MVREADYKKFDTFIGHIKLIFNGNEMDFLES